MYGLKPLSVAQMRTRSNTSDSGRESSVPSSPRSKRLTKRLSRETAPKKKDHSRKSASKRSKHGKPSSPVKPKLIAVVESGDEEVLPLISVCSIGTFL
jgi:hypothetical protein